jgi:hypothetical protein
MPEIKDMPIITITQEMIDAAIENKYQVSRTKVSNYDEILGPLGEMIFAQYIKGDWKDNQVGTNAGKVDFVFDTKNGKKEVEIKCSRFQQIKRDLNLLVREDYGIKRHPDFYVQIIIVSDNIKAGNPAYICGWTTSEEVLSSIPRDFGTTQNGYWEPSGYNCFHVPLYKLKPV